MDFLWIEFVCLYLMTFHPFVLSTSCTTYDTLSGEIRRSSAYVITSNDTAICDNFLVEKWYRIDSPVGNDIVRTCQSMTHCGTLYPLWMNGTLPLVSDGEVDRTVCQSGISGCCDTSLTIKVRNCGTFYVYFLRKPSGCPISYCFGTQLLDSTSATQESTIQTTDVYTSATSCTTYDTLSGEIRRSSAYVITSNDTAICDNFLVEKWYRIDSPVGNDIVRTCQSMKHCGTLYPLWMNGTLPLVSDGEVDRTVCQSGISGCCETSLTIKVRNCRTFFVYFLRKPSGCPISYCFGTQLEDSTSGTQESTVETTDVYSTEGLFTEGLQSSTAKSNESSRDTVRDNGFDENENVGIILGVIAAVLILIIVLIFKWVRFRRIVKPSNKEPEGESHSSSTATIQTATQNDEPQESYNSDPEEMPEIHVSRETSSVSTNNTEAFLPNNTVVPRRKRIAD